MGSIRQGAPIDFQIERSGNKYMDLNTLKLDVKVKQSAQTGPKTASSTNFSTVKLPSIQSSNSSP